jgi:hypothetical protein
VVFNTQPLIARALVPNSKSRILNQKETTRFLLHLVDRYHRKNTTTFNSKNASIKNGENALTTLRGLATTLLHFLRPSRKTILLIAIVAVITLISSASIAIWLSHSYHIHLPTVGTISLIGLEVYGGDIQSTNGNFSLDIGEIRMGTPKNVSFLLRNKSNTVTTLSITLNNWIPESLQSFMIISWNYTGEKIAPNEEIPIRIDITTETSLEFVDYIVTNDVKSFSLSLTIQAVEA